MDNTQGVSPGIPQQSGAEREHLMGCDKREDEGKIKTVSEDKS